jgi:hypothetical protein
LLVLVAIVFGNLAAVVIENAIVRELQRGEGLGIDQ